MVDTLGFAKILLNTGEASGRTKDDFHQEIEKRASETRRDGESPQQAYTRVLETPEGQVLHDAYKRAPAPRQAAQDLTPERPAEAGPASKKMNELARGRAKDRNKTFAQAYAQLIGEEEHKELYRLVREEERRATQVVHDQRESIWAAERAYSR